MCGTEIPKKKIMKDLKCDLTCLYTQTTRCWSVGNNSNRNKHNICTSWARTVNSESWNVIRWKYRLRSFVCAVVFFFILLLINHLFHIFQTITFPVKNAIIIMISMKHLSFYEFWNHLKLSLSAYVWRMEDGGIYLLLANKRHFEYFYSHN